VSIIASGITSSGNLPYIEMEYIEGPDLGELLKPPYEPVFTIKETIKVADQLANALAHCHRANIKHGDIKSNNVKFNQHTGNYILLDFGLSVMSDEQRRTSIRYAGAIEFMAPEQSSGETLFETDVYSFGIILFELLAGSVPFPLTNKGEMARNAVMLAHMETLPPDITTLRRDAISDLWNHEKTEKEMQIPIWLLSMIYQCLEKDPAKRFKSGTELQEFIHSGMLAEERKRVINIPAGETPVIKIDESAWRKEIVKLQARIDEKEEYVVFLQQQVDERDGELRQLRSNSSKRRGASKSVFVIVMIIVIGLGGFAAYNALFDRGKNMKPLTAVPLDNKLKDTADSSAIIAKPFKKIKGKTKKTINLSPANIANNNQQQTGAGGDSLTVKVQRKTGEYKIINNAYIYNAPNKTSKSDLYLTAGDATLTLLEEKNEFTHVVFINENGKKTKGWLLKKDFAPSNEY
jgi:serine/threonine-protein kinase